MGPTNTASSRPQQESHALVDQGESGKGDVDRHPQTLELRGRLCCGICSLPFLSRAFSGTAIVLHRCSVRTDMYVQYYKHTPYTHGK